MSRHVNFLLDHACVVYKADSLTNLNAILTALIKAGRVLAYASWSLTRRASSLRENEFQEVEDIVGTHLQVRVRKAVRSNCVFLVRCEQYNVVFRLILINNG